MASQFLGRSHEWLLSETTMSHSTPKKGVKNHVPHKTSQSRCWTCKYYFIITASLCFCRLCYKKPRDERFTSHILPVSTLIQYKMCRDWKFWQFLTWVLFICILGSCHSVSADCYDNVAHYCFQFHILQFTFDVNLCMYMYYGLRTSCISNGGHSVSCSPAFKSEPQVGIRQLICWSLSAIVCGCKSIDRLTFPRVFPGYQLGDFIHYCSIIIR